METGFRVVVIEDEGKDLANIVVQAALLSRRDALELQILPVLVAGSASAELERRKYSEELSRACDLLPSLPKPATLQEVRLPLDRIVAAVSSFSPGLILADSWLLQDTTAGLSILEKIKSENGSPAKWLMTRQVNVVGGELFRRGKYPLLAGSLDKGEILRAAIGDISSELAGAVHSSVGEWEARSAKRFGTLVGCHPTMLELFKEIRLASMHIIPIHIHGEPGVGKELVAREIHRLSGRRGELIAENCARLSPERADADLFGHVLGAFTGATGHRSGLIRDADRGTLFLDEIGDLPLSIQAKLLRVIDDGVVHAVGENQGTRVDVRYCSATNKNLQQATEDGFFRQDLYDRLCDITIRVPALRERASDIPLLVAHFASKWSEQNGKPIEVPEDVMKALQRYEWRGNVRQLATRIFNAAARMQDSVLAIADFKLEVRGSGEMKRAEGQELWALVRSGKERLNLAELARKYGDPMAYNAAEAATLELGGQREACIYFDMSHSAFRGWLMRARSRLGRE